MKAKTTRAKALTNSLLGAGLAVLCGLLLWSTPLGEAWVNASYDHLFHFGARPTTNQVVLILMDNASYSEYHQTRGQPWNRQLHATLLDRLALDHCPLVVFDTCFKKPGDPATDASLAKAIRSQRNVVLLAEQAGVEHPELAAAEPILPAEPFFSAAGSNHWGVGFFTPDPDGVVRRHWPFPSPGPYPSLPETAAGLAGARLSGAGQERWLRYYGENGACIKLSYQFAITQAPGYYRDKIVFIGNEPQSTVPDGGEDKFSTPFTHRTGEARGGIELLATEFLNLVDGDWLRRPVWWFEAVVLAAAGALVGGGLCRVRPGPACALAAVAAVAVALFAVVSSYLTNYWFPWLVIVGGQVPCALVWSLAIQLVPRPAGEPIAAPLPAGAISGAPAQPAVAPMPDIPDYEVFQPPFGEGAYGKVWLARNSVGEWQALKIVSRSNFGDNPDPYEREFRGITNYKPISDKHPGLLRVDFVSQKRPGYFYYVMELGDPLEPGWEKEPSTYKPRDLIRERDRATGRRLPIRDCVRIGLSLTEALEFLHGQGLTHRDIKPQNIIFVGGKAKLADVGLIAEIRPPGQPRTFVGTPGYMPPPPELPGTACADIYSLGMVLYVLSTGRNPAYFPELSSTLLGDGNPAEFFPLNRVILKACHPDPAQRYAAAVDMHRELDEVRRTLEELAQTSPTVTT